MPNSMTAYGRASSKTSFGHLTVEIQSVNRKHLDITLSMPKELARFEVDMRRWLATFIHRGQVTIRVHARYDAQTLVKVVPNIPLARELKQAWDQIGSSLGLDAANEASHFHLEMLAHEEELFSYEETVEDEASYREALKLALEEALQPFLAMRRCEGEALARDILMRLEAMKQCIEKISDRATGAPARYREKLHSLLAQEMPPNAQNEERLLREVILFVDRIDISEEITRARSHLSQMEALLCSDKPSLGKTLEFLLQELFREVNTISSKSTDLEISHAVVDFKSAIEKIREQTQNIE